MQTQEQKLLILLENRFKICSTPLMISLSGLNDGKIQTIICIEESQPGQYLVHGERYGGGYIKHNGLEYPLPEVIKFETTLSEFLSTDGVVIYKEHVPFYDLRLEWTIDEEEITEMINSVVEYMLQENPKIVLIKQYLGEILKSERDIEIFILHTLCGKSYDELGQRFCLTYHRVYQICKRCQKKLDSSREIKSKSYLKLKSELS